MRKNLKLHLLLSVTLLFTTACSTVPNNVSKNVYNTLSKIQDNIDDCINDIECNHFETNETVFNAFEDIYPKLKTDEEMELMEEVGSLSFYLVNIIDPSTKQYDEFMELEYKKEYNNVSKLLNKEEKYFKLK